jgi:hypothetical protein
MTLSKKQQDDDPKTKYQKWFWLWERDLLHLAHSFPAWREKAHELGFMDVKIDTPWTFPDAGRLIKYMENPFYKERQEATNGSKLDTETGSSLVQQTNPMDVYLL